MVAEGTNRADSIPRTLAARRCSSAGGHGCPGGWRWAAPGAWAPHRSRLPPHRGFAGRDPRADPSPPRTVHCRVLPVVVVAHGGAGHGAAHPRARPGHRVAPQVHGKRGTPGHPPGPEQPPPPQHRPHRRNLPPQGLPGGGGMGRAGIAVPDRPSRARGPQARGGHGAVAAAGTAWECRPYESPVPPTPITLAGLSRSCPVPQPLALPGSHPGCPTEGSARGIL